jgi:iron complex transport system substrate-binding protein
VISCPKKTFGSTARPAFFLILLAAMLLRGLYPPEAPDPAPKSGGREVTDMAGRLVHLEGPARRAVLQTPVAWHYLTATKSDESIAMVPPYMKYEFAESVLGRIFPALAAKPESIFDVNSAALFSAEQALLMNPDVILTWYYQTRDLEKIKFPGLIVIERDGRYKEKLYRVLGQLTGQEERVERMWARYRANEAALFAEMPPGLREKTLVVIGSDSFALWTGSAYRKFEDDLKNLRARNLAGRGPNPGARLNMESLLLSDPDFIFINPFSSYFTTLTVGDIYQNPAWRGLKATAQRRVYHMPLGAARMEGPYEDYLFLLWMALVLHQELNLDHDLRAEIRDSYQTAFDYEMSEDEIDAWLRLEENSFSSGYRGFDRRSYKF